eukprot:4043271-Amphidinium_carterae.1
MAEQRLKQVSRVCFSQTFAQNGQLNESVLSWLHADRRTFHHRVLSSLDSQMLNKSRAKAFLNDAYYAVLVYSSQVIVL